MEYKTNDFFDYVEEKDLDTWDEMPIFFFMKSFLELNGAKTYLRPKLFGDFEFNFYFSKDFFGDFWWDEETRMYSFLVEDGFTNESNKTIENKELKRLLIEIVDYFNWKS